MHLGQADCRQSGGGLARGSAGGGGGEKVNIVILTHITIHTHTNTLNNADIVTRPHARKCQVVNYSHHA